MTGDFKNFILKHIDEFDSFFRTTDMLILVVLDKDLNISACNGCFRKILEEPNDFSGRNIRSFLLPESQEILPFADSVNSLSINLNFRASHSSTLPLFCHIFKTGKNNYLILGGHLMLTSEQIIQKMTSLTNEMVNMSRDLHRKKRELEEAHSKIKILGGIIPICMHCKEIRDDKGYWNMLEVFITDHSEAQFSHGICDKCFQKYYSGAKENDDNT